MTLARLRGHSELLEAGGGDPFIRYAVPRALDRPAWRRGNAVALVRHSPVRRPSLLVLGPASDAGALVADMVEADEVPDDVAGVTVEQGSLAAVASHLELGRGHDWDWMYAVAPPPDVAQERHTVTLGADSADDLAALLAVANPGTDARPFAGPGQQWVGVRERGRLVACGVREPNPAGHPVVQGVTVHPDHRGHGLGLAVTARLTREALETAGVCTLGMYTDNAVARRLYLGLGYRLGHAWSSRRLS